jgi:hypothetical protein
MFVHLTSPAPDSGPLCKHNNLENRSFPFMELFSREVVFPSNVRQE